jgi:hypothetical protein
MIRWSIRCLHTLAGTLAGLRLRRPMPWAIGAAGCTVLAWSVAQTTPVPPVIGSYLELAGQVVAPSTSSSINSTYNISGNDKIQWTTYLQSRNTEPHFVWGEQLLPAGHTWSAGQVIAPPQTTMEYRVGTAWQLVEPNEGAAVTAVKWSMAPMVKITFGGISSLVDFSGTGDGFRIIPYKDKFYVVNHHSGQRYFNCRVAGTGEACPGFPTDGGGLGFSATAGDVLSQDTTRFYTPHSPMEALNYATGELFVGVTDKTDGDNNVKIACTDLDTLTSCGTFALGKANWSDETHTNLEVIANKYHVLRSDGMLHCFDITTKAQCGSYAYPSVDHSATYRGVLGVTSTQLGGKMFFTDNNRTWCHDPATNAPCSGWTA